MSMPITWTSAPKRRPMSMRSCATSSGMRPTCAMAPPWQPTPSGFGLEPSAVNQSAAQLIDVRRVETIADASDRIKGARNGKPASVSQTDVFLQRRFQLKKGLLRYRKPFLLFNTLVERPAHCAGLFCERLFLGLFQ